MDGAYRVQEVVVRGFPLATGHKMDYKNDELGASWRLLAGPVGRKIDPKAQKECGR